MTINGFCKRENLQITIIESTSNIHQRLNVQLVCETHMKMCMHVHK